VPVAGPPRLPYAPGEDARRRLSRWSSSLRLKEVMDMRRYLLVLDMDLLALDE
jgi:hypothetical protein